MELRFSFHQNITWCFVDIRKHVEEIRTPDGAAVDEQLDAWTAHKTETGAVYYYNALTGQSTYDKPLGFMGEVFTLSFSFFKYCNCVIILTAF